MGSTLNCDAPARLIWETWAGALLIAPSRRLDLVDDPLEDRFAARTLPGISAKEGVPQEGFSFVRG
jgi:hypothetical protein